MICEFQAAPAKSPTQASKPKGGKEAGKGKKGKKKFARHKIRSESPDKEMYDVMEDPAETQVATSGRKASQALSASGNPADFGGPQGVTDEVTEDGGDEKTPEVKGNQDDFVEEEDSGDGSPRGLDLDLNKEKDDPLQRRALLSLEKQLELDSPDSQFDLFVSKFFEVIFIPLMIS